MGMTQNRARRDDLNDVPKESGDVTLLKRMARDLVRTWNSTWKSKDTSNASQFYSSAPDLVFFDLGPTHIGWEQYKKNVARSFDTIDSLDLSLNDDLKVVVEDRMALTTATGHISYVTKNSKSVESDIRFTGVWEKRGGRWKLIHDHWSRSR
jgi:uncharacterized protein (TIGR02246 family)